jgi:fluoride exporter
MWTKLFWLSLAGIAGTLARYGLSGLVQRLSGAGFPWGTLMVNLCGCFLAGLIWALFEYRINLANETRTILFVGFLGAFTTFSAFMLETSHLLRDAEWFYAIGNLAMQNILGLICVIAGLALGKYI